SVPGDAAIYLPHFLELEKSAPLLARRAALACARCFHHIQCRLLRTADFFRTRRRGTESTTDTREALDAKECSLALRVYRETFVLETLGHGFRLFCFDLFGRGV